MNRLLKTMLGIVMCFSSALPAMAEIKVEEDNSDGSTIIVAADYSKFFYSTETITSTADIQGRKDALGITGALSDLGQSALIFLPATSYCPEDDSSDLPDLTMLSFCLLPTDSFKSKLETNDKLTIRFADGKTDEFYIIGGVVKNEDGFCVVTGMFGALNSKDSEIHRMPMNEEMIQYATSDIKSITCGGMTYHIKGHTAPLIKSLFATLFNHKGVSKEGFSIYLNGVGSKASSPQTAPVAAVSDNNYGSEDTALSLLLKNPAGYAGRSPFTSPGIYQPDFEKYASQNSLSYRTISGDGGVSLIFDNGVVPDNLMGYDCKFVAGFKNQILNGYVYQSIVLNREQAENLAQKLDSELMEMGNVDRAAGFRKSPDALFSERYLYGAGTRVTVDARMIDGRYAVSLMVSITHF